MMHTEPSIKKLLRSKHVHEVREGLREAERFDALAPVVQMMLWVWDMTYGQSAEAEFVKIGEAGNAEKIALMNEQEDLLPMELLPADEVPQLDLGGFTESVDFAELVHFKNLEILSFWENGFRRLPQSVFTLRHLQLLHVCTDLDELSPEISRLQSLKQLTLSCTHLTEIPQELALLPQLEILDLEGNELKTFPEFLLRLPMLKELVVSPSVPVSEEVKQMFAEKGIKLCV